jgi:trimeric autotransporter adhesin
MKAFDRFLPFLMQASACALLLTILSITPAFSQPPGSFNYQAILRDASGAIITSTPVSLTLSILQGSVTGSPVYSEMHNTTSNGQGLINLEVGSVSPADFEEIDWSSGPYFIKIEVDGIEMGTSQLLSVPYALYAKSSGSGAGAETDPVFTAHPANGIAAADITHWNIAYGWGNHASAGYAASSHVHSAGDITSGTLKADRGGTGISSYTDGNYLRAGSVSTLQQRSPAQVLVDIGAASASHTHEGLFTGSGAAGKLTFWTGTSSLSSNSNLHWDNTNGRLGIGTATPGRMLDIEGDIEVNTLRIGRGGGDKVSNTTMGIAALCLNTSGEYNTANGYGALFLNTEGSKNSAYGYRALAANTNGDQNTAEGKDALYSNKNGSRNTAVGCEALMSNVDAVNNTAIGNEALHVNTTGYQNTATGAYALFRNVSAFENTAIGYAAMSYTVDGNANTAVGAWSLYQNTEGGANVAVGKWSLRNNTSGSSNTAIGGSALENVTTGTNNIGIGSLAYVPSGTGDNQIRMGNTAITYAGIQVAWTVTSDLRWKESVRDLPYGIDFVSKLKPVDYIRKNNENKTREAGFIAQDIEALLKENGIDNYGLLNKTDDGMLELRYNDFIPILTRAIQEQQQTITRQQNEIEELVSEINRLKAIVEVLVQK